MLRALANLCHHRQLRGLLCILLPLLMAFASYDDVRRPHVAPLSVAQAAPGAPPPMTVAPSPHARNVRAAFFGEEGPAQLRTQGEPDPSATRPGGPFTTLAECERGPPGAWPPVLPAALGAARPHRGSVPLFWRTRGFGPRAPPALV